MYYVGLSLEARVEAHDKEVAAFAEASDEERAARLATAKEAAKAELSQQLIPVVWALFCRSSEQVATTLSAGGIQTADALVLGEVWHLCAKCMKRLLVSGFPPDAKTYQVHSQFKEMLPQMLQILKMLTFLHH